MVFEGWAALAVGIVAVLLAASLAITLAYVRQLRAVRKGLVGLGSLVVETAHGSIEYASKGDGYPLLVVHGALGGFDQGLWLAARNAPGFHVISVSRFGYLRTPVPSAADLDLQADIYASLLDALALSQVAVLAASAGSTSAIRFAARHPGRVSALVLLCPDYPPGIPLPPRLLFDGLLRSDFVYWLLTESAWKTVASISGMIPRQYALTPEHEEAIKHILRGNLPISRRIDGFIFETYTLDAEFRASASASSPYPLQCMDTPVFIINALDDPITIPESIERMAGQLPNARHLVVRDGGHFFFGHAAEVSAEIVGFLHNNTAALQAGRVSS